MVGARKGCHHAVQRDRISLTPAGTTCGMYIKKIATGARSLAAKTTTYSRGYIAVTIGYSGNHNHTCRRRQGGRRCQKYPSTPDKAEPLRIPPGAPYCIQPAPPRTSPDGGQTPKRRGLCELSVTCAITGFMRTLGSQARVVTTQHPVTKPKQCVVRTAMHFQVRDSPAINAEQPRVPKLHVQRAPETFTRSGIVLVYGLRHVECAYSRMGGDETWKP